MTRGELYFEMKLALALHKTLKELRREVGGSQEMELWKQFDVVEPFGAWRDDWRFAQLCEMYANRNYTRPGGKFEMEDFVHKYRPAVVTVEDAVASVDPDALIAKLHTLFGTLPPN